VIAPRAPDRTRSSSLCLRVLEAKTPSAWTCTRSWTTTALTCNEGWLEASPLPPAFTPTSPSWLNLVERHFVEITPSASPRTFRNVSELTAAINDYVRHTNAETKPMVWATEATTSSRRSRSVER
jgi:hypothetical protein